MDDQVRNGLLADFKNLTDKISESHNSIIEASKHTHRTDINQEGFNTVFQKMVEEHMEMGKEVMRIANALSEGDNQGGDSDV